MFQFRRTGAPARGILERRPFSMEARRPVQYLHGTVVHPLERSRSLLLGSLHTLCLQGEINRLPRVSLLTH